MSSFFKKTFLSVFFIFLFILAVSPENKKDKQNIQSSESNNKTVLIAMDKSLSMVEEIQAVKEYMIDVVDKKINIGDNLIIIPFYGRNDFPISLTIRSEEDKTMVKNKLNSIFAVGVWTDLGGALDLLKSELAKFENDTNRKSLILITDSKDEPPPWSKYKRVNAYLNDDFLKSTKEEIIKEGWKVIYLDIGGHSDAKVVDEISTHYVKMDENLTKEQQKKQLTEKMPNVTTTININGKVKVQGINQKGESKITIPVKIENLENNEVMQINGIELAQLAVFKIDIADKPFIEKFTENGEKKIEIPLIFSGDLKPGNYKDTFKFIFSEDTKEHFNRSIDNVEFRVNNFFFNYLWLFIIIIIIVLVIIALGLYYLYTFMSKPKIKFRFIIDEAPLPEGKDVFKAIQGKYLYLTEESGTVSILKTRSLATIARIGVAGKRLKMTVLNEDKIPAGRDLPVDVSGFKFAIISDKKQQVHAKFEKM